MLENLFIPDNPSGVNTSEVELSEEIQNWPLEIQSAIMSSVPILSEVPGQLMMDAVDQDKMYAKGSYVVDTPDDKLVIPIVIKAKQMCPIDTFIYKDKWYPMDPQTITSILTSAQLGSGLMAPQDMPPTAASGMQTRTSPPGSYGTGSGLIQSLSNKLSHVYPKITEKIVAAIATDGRIKRNLANNEVAKLAMIAALETPYVEKQASAVNPFKGTDAVVISHGNGQFTIKSSARRSVKIDSMQCDGNTLADLMIEAGVEPHYIVNSLVTNKIAMTWDDSEAPEDTSMSEIKEAGVYQCVKSTPTGVSTVNVEPLCTVKTATNESKTLVITSDGEVAFQDKIAGKKISSVSEAVGKYAKLASAISKGDTIVVPIPQEDSNKKAPVTAFSPVKVSSIVRMSNGINIVNGDSATAGKVAYIVTEDKFECPIPARQVPAELMVQKNATAWYVPADYTVFSIPSNTAKLAKSDADASSMYALSKMASGKSVDITPAKMWRVGKNSVAIKLAGKEPEVISDADALLYLRKSEGSGTVDTVMNKMAAGMVKTINLTGAVGKSIDDIATRLTSASKAKKSYKNIPVKMSSSLKVASILDDEEDVNTVLALNYLTPENMEEFKAALPDMEKTEEALTKLLMSTRLGNNLVEEHDVKSTLNSLHSIIQELKSAL